MRTLVLLVLLGCGSDPRTQFTGEWTGQVVQTLTVAGTNQTGQAAATWDMGLSDLGTDRVQWLTVACDFTAKVTSDTSLVLDAVNCRTQTFDNGCTLQTSIDNGSGTRTGTSLAVTWGGTLTGQCSGTPENGTYTARFDGSR